MGHRASGPLPQTFFFLLLDPPPTQLGCPLETIVSASFPDFLHATPPNYFSLGILKVLLYALRVFLLLDEEKYLLLFYRGFTYTAFYCILHSLFTVYCPFFQKLSLILSIAVLACFFPSFFSHLGLFSIEMKPCHRFHSHKLSPASSPEIRLPTPPPPCSRNTSFTILVSSLRAHMTSKLVV